MVSTEQTPLSSVLRVSADEQGNYVTRLPHSTCFGNMCFGGIIVSYFQAAAADHCSKNPKTARQVHPRSLTVNFLRPTFPDPEKCVIHVRPISVGKLWSTIHVELSQKEKTCVVGYITLTDFSRPAGLSAGAEWSLSPPPPTVPSLRDLEADTSPTWISISTPYVEASFRRAMSYVKYFIPLSLHDPTFLDQWVTPDWKEPGSEHGAMWTNETILFIADNSLPVWDNLLPKEVASGDHSKLVAEGHAQRAARGGASVRINKGAHATPTIPITLGQQTEFKKRLPAEGVKWLLMRARVGQIQNGRTDLQILLVDEGGALVARTNQVAQVAETQASKSRRSVL